MTHHPRCAVVFKTYAWDDFVERQARRLADAAGALDFYVSVDETNGSVGPIPFERVARFTCATLAASGLPMRYLGGWRAVVESGLRPLSISLAISRLRLVPVRRVRLRRAMLAGAVCCPRRLKRRQLRCSTHRAALQQMALDALSARCLFCGRGQARSAECLFVLCSRAEDVASAAARHARGSLHCAHGRAVKCLCPARSVRAGMTWLSLAEFGDVSHCDWFPPTMEEDLRPSDRDTFYYTRCSTGGVTSPLCCTIVARLRPANSTVPLPVSGARNTPSLYGLRPAKGAVRRIQHKLLRLRQEVGL